MTQISLSGFVPVEKQPRTDIKQLTFKLHSIIMLIGPYNSGKTAFAMEQMMIQLKMAETGSKKLKIAYIGIEQILTELFDDDITTKSQTEINEYLGQANDIVYSKLKSFTAYPVNSDFIVLDTTGLDSNFRDEIAKIAEDNHYNLSAILFDFKDPKEHLSAGPGQVKEMRRLKSGGLSKSSFSTIETITSKDFEQYEIVVEDYDEYQQYILPYGPDYVVIGDIHGCLDEFHELLKKNGFIIDEFSKVSHPEGKKVVLVGDLVDKGYAIKEVIEFVHLNLDIFYMVIGNHENFVYKVLNKIFKAGDMATPEVRKEFFNSIEIFEIPVPPVEPVMPKDESNVVAMEKYEEKLKAYKLLMSEYVPLTDVELEERILIRQKFCEVYDAMKSFYVHKNFIVTHAPCEQKYLGKISKDALKATRDFRYPKRRDYETFHEFITEFDERAAFATNEANDSYPIHIFGHVMTKEVSNYKNKIDIDTGCVAGGSLTSVIVTKYRKLIIDSVAAGEKTHKKNSELHNFFYKNLLPEN